SFVTRRGSESIRYNTAKLRAIVGEGSGRKGVTRRGGSRDVYLVALPLKTELCAAGRRNQERGRLSLRHSLIRWLTGNDRRRIHRQGSFVTRRGSESIRYDTAKLRAIVGECGRGYGVAR